MKPLSAEGSGSEMALERFQGLKTARGLNENNPATQEARGSYCQPPCLLKSPQQPPVQCSQDCVLSWGHPVVNIPNVRAPQGMGSAASRMVGRPLALFQAGQDRVLPPDSLLWLALRCHQYRAGTANGMMERRHRSLEATCRQ